VQAEIHDAGPATGPLGAGNPRGIGGHSTDRVPGQQCLGVVGKPRLVPRLADHNTGIAISKQLKKSGGHPRIKGVRRRQLHEEWTPPRAESRDFFNELLEWCSNPQQHEIVRNGP
jgi:hypothetical protein